MDADADDSLLEDEEEEDEDDEEEESCATAGIVLMHDLYCQNYLP